MHGGRSASTQRRRWILLGGSALAAIVIVLLVLGALSYRSISHARDQLNDAHAAISQALGNRHQLGTEAGRQQAEREIARVREDANAARSTLDSSWALKVLGKLPLLSTQREGLLQLVDDVETTATSGDLLLQHVNRLTADSSGTTVSLPDLSALQQSVATAHARLAESNRPSNGLWGPLGSARDSFNTEDRKLTDLLATGNQVLSYLLPMLGANGPRNYLVAGENNAEMRDQGAVLSLALLHAANGSFSLDTTNSVGENGLSSPANVEVPAGTNVVFGGLQPTQLWQSVNATADYPFSGRDMQAMYQQSTGVHVDGVVALDVPALVSLLQLTGPVTIADVAQPISASNAAEILLHQLYSTFPAGSQTERHDDISAVARAAIDKMKTEHVDLAALAQALARDVAGRHLIMWDENPLYEKTITDSNASGAIDTTDPDRSFHLAVESATAAKLDYYVTTAIRMDVTITDRNEAVIYTYATISNHAPAGQPPSYQLGPDNINSFTPGQYVSRVYLWSPRGSQTAAGISESGLVVNQTAVSVLPRQQQQVIFKTIIPDPIRNGRLDLHLVPQPTLSADPVTVQLAGGPNWIENGPSTQNATLDKPIDIQWNLTPRS